MCPTHIGLHTDHGTCDAALMPVALGYIYVMHAVRPTHTQPFSGRLSRTTRVGQYQKKHSPTDTNPDHQTSFINFLHLLRSIASSLFNLRAWQSFSTISLHSFVWGPLLRTPYISSPIHCLLFATHAHTIAACFSVISVLCHLFLISL